MTTVPYSTAEGDAVASSAAGLTAVWVRTLVDGVAGTARIAGRLEAVQATQIAELARTRRSEAVIEARDAVAQRRRFWADAETVHRCIVDELASALRVSTGVAGRRLAMAESLVGRPVTLRALTEGRIHASAAYAIAEGVGLLDGDAADGAEARVLAAAGRQTPAQVAAAVRRAVIAADPAAADRAYRRAVEARSARCRPEEDGMASIWISGSADRIARAWQTATAVAEHRRHLAHASGRPTGSTGTGHPARVPTLDQARADAMLDLLSSPEGLPDPCHHTDPDGRQPDGHAQPDGHTQTDGHASTDSCAESDGNTQPDGHNQPGDAGHDVGARHDQCVALPPVDVVVRLVLPVDALRAEPAELDGHGPVPPAFVADLIGAPPCPCRRDRPTADTTAATRGDGTEGTDATDAAGCTDGGDQRRFPADAGRVRFTRWLVDGAGVVTSTSQRVFPTYRPPSSLDATIRARDLTCRFPGCRTKARYCDIDHAIPYPAGATTATNLACLCRRHHRLKTHTRFHVAHRAGAVLEWTAPTGRTYLTYPPTWVIGQRPGTDDTPTPITTPTTTPTPPSPEMASTPPAWMFGRPANPDPSPSPAPAPAPATRLDTTAGYEPASSRLTGADTADEVVPPF